MFLPTDSSKHRSPVPADTRIRESDWLILSSFWHPVAFARDVADALYTGQVGDWCARVRFLRRARLRRLRLACVAEGCVSCC